MNRSLIYIPVLAAFLAVVLPVVSQTLAPWVGPNVQTGTDPVELPPGTGKNQAEPHIIRSPVDPDLLLATFQEGRFSDGGARNNGYAVSEDGGFTWSRALNPLLTQLSGGPYFRATDPVGGISLNEVLYLNSLASVDESFGVGELVIQRSMDRGKTWTAPISIYRGISEGDSVSIFPDKNWMTVNNYPGSPSDGRVVVTWTDFRTIKDLVRDIEDFVIMSSYSDDLGSSWSSPVFVTPPDSDLFSRAQFQGSQPVFLPGGGLAVVFHRFQPARLEIAYSPDGGQSFPFSPAPVHSGYFLFDAPNLRDGSFLPSVAVARESGDIYVCYTSRPSSTNPSGYIFFTRSERKDPGGAPSQSPEWNFRIPMNISGLIPVRVVNTPTLSVSPDGQRVTVHFFDNRNDISGNFSGDFHAVQSVDGGATWTAPFRLSAETFDFRKATNTSRGYMLGDYFGMAAPEGPKQAAVAIWVDTRLATADPWTARIGGLEDGVFESWLQANLPFAFRGETDVEIALEDPDLDGTPNLLEYILGRSPLEREILPLPADGLQHFLLADGSDPELSVTVQGGTGRWPSVAETSDMVPLASRHGEGYWDSIEWPLASQLDHLEIVVNGQIHWFLLGESSPVRWVRELPGDWIRSHWLGYIYTGNLPWLYHPALGWIYDLNGLFYSPVLGSYLFPDFRTFPWMAKADGGWIYVFNEAPWIYDSSFQDWIRTH